MSGLIAAIVFSGIGYGLFSVGTKTPGGAGAAGSVMMLAGGISMVAAVFSFGFAAGRLL